MSAKSKQTTPHARDGENADKAVASRHDSSTRGTPIGDCTPDEPGNMLPAEPVSIAKIKNKEAKT